MAAVGIGPDPQNVKLEPGASHDFSTPGGLTGTRYWPKMRCDDSGNACGIGESGGPQETCDSKAGGCAPPVDTKFEATFGSGQEADWVDISLVDGFTLPFKFEMKGDCKSGFGKRKGAGSVVDCSKLSFALCPTAEDLGLAGSDVNLKVIHPLTKDIVGCYSPCSKLTLAQWGNTEALGIAPNSDKVAPYCCPTPPESPKQCRAGPIKDTKFVQAVHQMCPGVYGYSYDDGMGLLRCPSDTMYEVTFFCAAANHTGPPLSPGPTPSPGPAPPPGHPTREKAAPAPPAAPAAPAAGRAQGNSHTEHRRPSSTASSSATARVPATHKAVSDATAATGDRGDAGGSSAVPWLIVLLAQSLLVCFVGAYVYRLRGELCHEPRPTSSFLVPPASPRPFEASMPSPDTWRARTSPSWSPKDV